MTAPARAVPPDLHVFYTVPRGFGGMGGIERHSGYLAAALAEPGWQGLHGIQVDFVATRGPGALLLSPLYLGRAMLRILGARLRGETVLLHLTLASGGSTLRKVILAGWARLLGARYLVHLRGALFREFLAGRGRIGRAAIHWLFGRAAHVVVLGEPWRDFVVAEAGAPADRVTVLPNAVPDPQRDPAPGSALGQTPADAPCRILFLGRIGDRKGVPELIAALAEVHRLHPGLAWQAVLAGDGDTAPYLRQAEAAGLAGRIAFPGWQDGPATAALFAGAGIFVLPSHAENLPVAVLEAASYGLPIVATPVGAVPDHFTDGGNALLVPPGEVAPLAAALARLLADPAERARLGAAARQSFADNFSITAYRDRLAAIYRQLLPA